jgi:hypothetical protein
MGIENLYYSTDGINWTPGFKLPSVKWTSIEYGNGKFVVGSYIQNLLNSTPTFYSATDPTGTWTPSNPIIDPQTLPLLGTFTGDTWGFRVRRIVYGNGIFLAGGLLQVGFNNSGMNPFNILTSTDGINWNWDNTTLPFYFDVMSIARGNDRFVINGRKLGTTSTFDYVCLVKVDGSSTWVNSDLSGYTLHNVIYDNSRNRFMNDNNFVSNNGINWTQLSNVTYWGIEVNNTGRIVALKDGYLFYRNDSGDDIRAQLNTHDQSENPSMTASDQPVWPTNGVFDPSVIYMHHYYVKYANGMFISLAIYKRDSVSGVGSAYSYDGINWAAFTMPPPRPDQSCVYNWIDIGPCVNDFKPQRLNVTTTSSGNGTPCPGISNSGRLFTCSAGSVARHNFVEVPIEIPPPEIPPPEIPPRASSPEIPVDVLPEPSILDGQGVSSDIFNTNNNVVSGVIQLVNQPVTQYAIDHNDNLYYVVDGAIYVNSEGYVKERGGSTNVYIKSITDKPITDVQIDNYDNIYFIAGGYIYMSDISRNTSMLLVESVYQGQPISEFTVDKTGIVYFIEGGSIYKNIPKEGTSLVQKPLTNYDPNTAISVDNDGNLYFISNGYIYKLYTDGNLKIFIKPINEGEPITDFTIDENNNTYFIEGEAVNMMDRDGNLSTILKSPERLSNISYTVTKSYIPTLNLVAGGYAFQVMLDLKLISNSIL